MKSDSKSALKIRQIVLVFILMIIGGTILQLTAGKNMAQEAKSDVQKDLQVAETFEREFKITSRSEVERTQVITAAKAVINYKSIDEITISRDMDLTVPCGVSREDFIELMTNLKVDTSGFFEDNAGTIYDLCQKYELNEVFFCGLIAGESGWNIAGGHRRTHNYISMMSGGKLIQYGSDAEGLEAAAKLLHTRYLSEGGSYYRGKTLSSVQKIFCPNSSTWVGLIYGCMSQVVK